MTKVDNTDVRTESVLYGLMYDQATIVRLIKQDLVVSLMLQKSGSHELILMGISDLELNKIVFDLMLLDRCSNGDEVMAFYDRLIEDSCKMLIDFPTMSKEELALNCYYEVKNKCKW